MKAIAIFAIFALCSGAVVNNEDRTITKVVKLLQEMLETSQKEGDEERVLYAKFKCYCDTSEAEKRESIKKLTQQIELLENEIAEIQGDTGGLSSECAKLKEQMAENKAARDTATELRKKEKKAYEATKEDLEQAIGQLKEAIQTLAEVGADQTQGAGADHKQFMAGYKGAALIKLQSRVQSALRAASDLMNMQQHAAASAFLQAPFTGTYTSQSAEVLGILKEMRDTFIKNLAEATATEEAAVKAYKAFMKIKEEEYDEMEKSYNSKQKALGNNDETLAAKKQALEEAKKQLASDEEFLEKLLPMCAEKAEQYDKRKMLRANEEAAIAEAIAILNNDQAFATFGEVDATKSGATGFLQLRAVRAHKSANAIARSQLQKVLRTAASKAKSSRLSKVLDMVKADNPFDTVLEEISKMLDLIVEEGKQDKENLDWCNSEREEYNANLKKKKAEILSLNEEIDKLDDLINNPETGLKAQIEQTEEELVKNKEAQTTETKERTEDNLAYQKDIKHLVEAEAIIKKAIKVLSKYYGDLEKKVEGTGFVQEDPNPPDTWEAYEGQSTTGNKVIAQLEFILGETQKEETEAHSDEEKAQADYEDSMTDLKKKEAEAEKALAELKETLAEKEKELLQAKEDLKATIKEKETIEAYLAKIKPGCDFITENFDVREKNRKTETEALEKCQELIKGTPAYKAAKAEEHQESLGKCKETCNDAGEEHAKCKACLADVTVPGYCAGHAGTEGC